jgi:small subunit ribosomal protein S1
MSNSIEPKVGDIIDGRIVKFLDWGALIALPGGFVARLPNAHISWSKQKVRVDDLFRIGEGIRVTVREASRSKAHGKLFITLSYRELQPNPWDDVEEKFPVGTHVSGRIIDFLPFGAIVKLDDHISGLLHDSEISWTDRDAKTSKVFKIDDLIIAFVTHVDKDKRKLHLSYRETQPNPWDSIADTFPIGTHTNGHVLKCTEYGFFIKLSNGCVALMHNSKVPTAFTADVGSIVNVVIIDVDSVGRRIAVALPACA